VVDEVTVSVGRGEILGIVGESGSGKTTLALALLGHCRSGLEHAEGRVVVAGLEMLKLGERGLEKARGKVVTYVPQDPTTALNPARRIRVQLGEMLTAHLSELNGAGREARLNEVLADVRLGPAEEILRAFPHQLSGGQQQRVCIAMALICRPELIVLDEPTTGLDVTTQRHVLDTVIQVCKDYGPGAVYVSHDLAVVSGLAQRVAVMYAGRIVEMAETNRLFSDPKHPYTKALLRSIPDQRSGEPLRGLEGRPPRPGQRGAGCAFAPRCASAITECFVTSPGITLGSDGREFRCLHPASSPSQAPTSSKSRPVRPPGGVTDALLRIELASAHYGPKRVLAEVNAEIGRHECVAVVGESGSGKTTLVRCIIGLHRKWVGDVYLQGERLDHTARRRPSTVLRRLRYVSQNPYSALDPRKTVEQSIAAALEQLAPTARQQRRAAIHHALELVSLGAELAQRFPHELSGGERQRVAIARALIVDPDLLVCDEVTSALDVSVQANVVNLLGGLRQERGLAMIFVTHNLGLVRVIADRVIVLMNGEVVEVGTVDQVIDNPRHEYTAKLLADAPLPPRTWRVPDQETRDGH
jgi:peptide/nickel transport system ATP-binding protein